MKQPKNSTFPPPDDSLVGSNAGWDWACLIPQKVSSLFGSALFGSLFLLVLFLLPTSKAAVLDFSAELQDVQVAPAGGTVTYQVFDPAVGSFVADSDSTGSIFNLSSNNGVVTWNNGVQVFFRIYDPNLGLWVKTNANVGTRFVSAQRNGQGVVTWVDGIRVASVVYDAARQEWRGGAVDNFAAPTLALSETSTPAWIAGNQVVGFQTYDPITGEWTSQSIPYGNTVILGNLQARDGVVTWSANSVINFSTYDPIRSSWANQSIPAVSTTFDLTTSDGVVAWSSTSIVYFYAYDPLQGAWEGIGTAPAGNVINLRVLSGSVFWTAGGISRTAGYNVTNETWSAELTVPYAYFGASSLSNNAPHGVYFFDMSLGASSWTWNFDDGTVSSKRSPFHLFESFDRHDVTLSVTGPAGGVATNGLSILSDIEAPEGTVLINNGDEFTTNLLVNLTLDAMDNSGVVDTMRFSNDGENWSDWEPYSIAKDWLMDNPVGTNTVYAQFQDVAENVSETAQDTIGVDTTPPPTISFNPGSIVVLENTNLVPVLISLSASFTRTVSVDVGTLGNTAFEDLDFFGFQSRLEFPPGQTTQSVNLTIIDDLDVELTESFFLTLMNPSNAVVAGNATVTIIDDDQPSVSFSTNQFVIPEGGGLANIIARLNGPSATTITVGYTTSGGTATPDQDYLQSEGRLTFAPGQTAAAFSIPILQDTLGELNETVGLQLNTPTNAILGSVSQSTLVILDDDPPEVNFASPNYDVSEGAGSAFIQVELNKEFDQTVFVDYATMNGTALTGSDYFATINTLIFAPGQTNKSFLINLINDTAPESSETVRLLLNGFVNATPGPLVEAILNIEDDDILRLNQPSRTSEGYFNVRITGPIGQVLNLQISTNMPQWNLLERLTNQTGIIDYIDEGAAGEHFRLYRLESP